MDHHLPNLSRKNFDKIYLILNNLDLDSRTYGDVLFKTYGVGEVNVSRWTRYAIFQIIYMSLLFGYSSGLESIEKDIDMNGNRVINLPFTIDSEPVIKCYTDTHYSGRGGGSQGPQGPQGIQGLQGPKGDQG